MDERLRKQYDLKMAEIEAAREELQREVDRLKNRNQYLTVEISRLVADRTYVVI